ncbi:MAG TPA: LptF/LptG family permease [Candidatus Krumholzibacteria bacterium]|nr:LptF/LptG family permease [Candidatus Krumholzibacteria bacterium]
MLPRIHDRYLLKSFLRVFLFAVVAFVIIYITVNVFEEIDNFIDHDAKLIYIARYYFYSLPFVLTYVIPVSLLLGTVFSMGVLARRNELTALLASGVSLTRVARPIFATSLVIALFSIYFNDDIVSRANRLKDDVMHYDIEGRVRAHPELRTDFRFLGEHGFVYLASSYDTRARTLYEVVVQQFEHDTVVRRIDAKSATWLRGRWRFNSGYVRTFKNGAENVAAFDTLTVPEMKESPDDFAEEEVNEEDMNLVQLRRFISKVHRSGGDVEKYMVDMYFKFSFPFAGAIFVLIGVALASGKRKPSIATGFGLTLVVSFMYYAVLRVGQTLGHNGVLPPFFAAQAGNILFLIIGLIMLKRADR